MREAIDDHSRRSPVEQERASDSLVLAVVCIAQFMVVVDTTIVNVALRNIQVDLGLSPSGLTWIINAYAIPFAGFLLLGGRAADFWGRRRLFLVGLGLFTSMSLVGGLAQNGGQLIGARAVQGLGAAALSPATLTILLMTFTDPVRRAKALGIWAAVAGLGGAVGVLGGGILTDLLSWRWVLFVNVPIGLALFVLARRAIVETRSRVAGSTLDWSGAVTVTVGLLAIVYGMVSTDDHPWVSSRVLVPMIGGIVLLGVFVAVERRHPHPLVPLRIFRSHNVTGANLVMLLVFPANFTLLFFLSQYMQDVAGFSPLRTGVAFLPMPFGFVLGAQVSARLVGRIGARRLVVVGSLITAVGLALLSTLEAHDNYFLHVGLPASLTMFGLSSAYIPATFAASGVDPRDAGLASGLVNATRTIGGSLGLAAMASIAASRTQALSSLPADIAQTSGYARGVAACAMLCVVAAVVGWTIVPKHRASTVTSILVIE
ncbi:MAG: MFS transporter [Ilumatobacteraceae bacterium]